MSKLIDKLSIMLYTEDMDKVKNSSRISEVPILIQAGLSEKEAKIYEILLKLGKTQASPIVKESKLKRATVYSVLEELQKKSLVEKDESSPIVTFRAKHPYALKSYLQSRVQEVKRTEEKLDTILSSYISQYHDSQVRPGVRFYEGKDGMWEVLMDSLSSKSEILSIVDVEAVYKYAKDINDKYVESRNRRQLKKRLMVIDTPFAHERFKKSREYTDIAFIPLDTSRFNTTLHLYDNKAAYITITKDYITSMIIDDQHVYNMHRSFFEILWKKYHAATAASSDSTATPEERSNA
jgi:HTH-type transcriptional regulator, sugar sensing transcriptional regulator